MVRKTESGLYCEQADVYIDPVRSVDKAILTHAHSDHAKTGIGKYLSHERSEQVLRERLGKNIALQTLEFGQTLSLNGVKITLFPAGHIPGSAQVKLEYNGEIWVVSGDYKLNDDGISTPFEPVKCHHFITESTFGLPVFKWKQQQEVFSELNNYWRDCVEAGENLVVIAYSLGKAQRVIKNVDRSIGSIYCHPAVALMNRALEMDGFEFGDWQELIPQKNPPKIKGALIVCPPSAESSNFLKQFEPYKTAMCSGWMALRGTRRWGNTDRGFVLSDHADWTELETACLATGAENIYVTHGYSAVLARYLTERHGVNACSW